MRPVNEVPDFTWWWCFLLLDRQKLVVKSEGARVQREHSVTKLKSVTDICFLELKEEEEEDMLLLGKHPQSVLKFILTNGLGVEDKQKMCLF